MALDIYFYDSQTVNKACQMLWDKLSARAGQATKEELDYAWDNDPYLLDVALVVLRDKGMIACTAGTWFMRESAAN